MRPPRLLMKDSNYIDMIKLISSQKAVNIINSLPKAVFFKWPLKFIKGVFTWRRASPLGRASPSKRAVFHLAFTWEKPVLLPGLTRLAESPGLTTFSHETRNPTCIFTYKFSFSNLHTNKQHL